MPSSGNLEKVRGKVALEPGYSLMAWMRLSKGADLTGGVGLVDEDEDEGTWRQWSLAEVAKHNTAEDAWMVLRGKVYNITPYLRYHPGGVSPLVAAAGTDGTALFDKFHAWVNAEGMLASGCVGTLAKPTAAARRGPDTEPAPPSAPPSPPASPRETEARRKTVTWHEQSIAEHDAMRGVQFGTMKIDQLDTPFLYLDEDGGESVAIHPSYLPTHLPAAKPTGAPAPYKMDVKELQDALGVVEMDADGFASFSAPKWAQADEFGAKRKALYSGEARLAALSEGLPEGWSVSLSSSEPKEPFYYHRDSDKGQWERPV